MKINVHIEHLILDGLPATGKDGVVVRAAVEAELTRLLIEQGLRGISGGAVPRSAGGSIQLATDGKPNQLGSQIAAVIYTNLRASSNSPESTSDLNQPRTRVPACRPL